MRQAAVLTLALAARALALAGGAGAPVSAEASAGFGGWFRPGCAVPFRVTIHNRGAAFAGHLDLVVEGIAWRKPVTVGAGASATVDLLAAVHSASARVAVRIVRDDGEALLDAAASPALRERPAGQALVAVVDGAGELAARLRALGPEVVEVTAERLPRAAAGYLGIDALAVAGNGLGDASQAGIEVRQAVAGWVHQGGLAAFALEPDEVVAPESLLGETSQCGSEMAAGKWLAWARQRPGAEAVGEGVAWRLGLGRVAAALPSDAWPGATAALAEASAARRRGGGNAAVAPELYQAFDAPPWTRAARWRVAGAALAMLAAVAVAALTVPRGWGRWRRAGCIVWLVAFLAVAAWWVVVPGQPAALDTLTVVEAGHGQGEGCATTLACLTGAARGRVRLDFAGAASVLPIYHDARDAGTWEDVVVAWGAEGGPCTVSCEVRRGVRRCFAVPWGELWRPPVVPAREGADGIVVRRRQVAVGDGWQSLRRLGQWGDLERGAVRWQARRWAGGGTFRARWGDLPHHPVHGRRLLATRRHPALLWVEVRGD